MNALKQSVWIDSPSLTEKNLPDQTGRVFIVTGGYAGCGLELAKILYSANGTVYIAGRSASKGSSAISTIRSHAPSSKGKVDFLELDLSDLKTIKPAVEAFNSKETRLDVLTNNAGVMFPPEGSKDAQGFELMMGTNCVGPFLFTKLLHPVLQKTAAASPPGSVRVTWAGSVALELFSPNGGLDLDDRGQPAVLSVRPNYGQSKAGNLHLASESARRYGRDGIVHVCWNPGNLRTDLYRHVPAWQTVFMNLSLYPVIYGAYTELYAGWSSDITMEQNGAYIVPWGKIGTYRKDIAEALKSKQHGGTGKAEKFWSWLEGVTSAYA